MSKIICEVCGTSYPDSAAQCPICGCVKPQGKQTIAGDTQDSTDAMNKRPAVRGGRFSKSNVRKRNKVNAVPVSATEKPRKKTEKNTEKDSDKKNSSGKGLTILAVILLLAILAMLAYIALRFFVPIFGTGAGNTTDVSGGDSAIADSTTIPTGSSAATDDTTADTTPDLSCRDLILTDSVVELTSEGQACLLNVTPVPADTEDEITYSSSDESVATVSNKGKVMAIAPGQTEITITCGSVSKTCRIIVSYEVETTAPEDTTAATTEPEETQGEVLVLNREDFTLAYKGEEWQLYNGSIAKPLITWTSSNTAVATVDGGKVVAVGPGMCTIYAEYEGQKVSCIVRCSFAADDGGFNTGVGEG